MKSRKLIVISKSVFLVLLLGLAAGCGGEKEKTEPQPIEVSTINVVTETLKITSELPGRISPVRTAEVRARATGILLKRLFEEGAEVKEGQPLFEIDPLPLKAALSNSEAGLAKAEASFSRASAQAKRLGGLVKLGAISREENEAAEAALKQARAEVVAAKAELDIAKLNLEYASVTAPISGTIGRALVTEGALVSAQEATQLAVINQLDPVYFDFTQSSTELLQLKKQMEEGALTSIAPGQAKVTLLLEDGTLFPDSGKLLFSDVSVDSSTGTVTLRALFPNTGRKLLPGMFARGKLEQAKKNEAIAIPQRAVTRNPDGTASVLIVAPDDTVQVRQVEVGSEVNGKWIISTGLNAGERIMIEGAQKVKPGKKVRAIPYEVKPPDSPTPNPIQLSKKD